MVRATIGFMSAPDAAPLPRLGEVFFDVRGSSRSMRLSWYADTDVAVFSIWQGGMCTGTFRLPMGDLTRMIEILRRGPQGSYEDGPGERGGPAEGRYAGYDEAGYDDDDYEDADYREADYAAPGFRADDYGAPRHGGRDYGAGPAGPGYRDRAYDEADYEQPSRGRRGARWPDEGSYQPDVTGQRSVAADQTGYDQQRIVPPYVGPRPESSQAGYSGDSEYRLTADPGARARHSAGRHSGGEPL
jgi:hypothetical protein